MHVPRLYRLQRLASAIDRLETELVHLNGDGLFVALQRPAVLHGNGTYRRTVRVQTTGAMRTGVAIGIVVDFDILRLQRTNTYLVIREEQHFKASIFGQGELLRYESGHRSHKQHPHYHGTWCQLRGLPAPKIEAGSAVSLTAFVRAIEAWRLKHAKHLPADPTTLGAVRA